jgi:hypothetical protein
MVPFSSFGQPVGNQWRSLWERDEAKETKHQKDQVVVGSIPVHEK